MHMTNKDVWAIVQISIDPRFELGISLMSYGMNGKSWENMNVFIKFAMTLFYFIFNFFDKYPKLPSIYSCVPNYKKPQLNFFKNFTNS